ncbi:M48 family metallopeptidase [Halorientalis brevis]|uniref:M48 family metallopeptidase n=1 Tax=Halorientalis brevis TaxID=1126241 RepID=A0ABD6C5N1_9EURY|nr:M48 family metalloprotease [Halorientalis brevis]
MGRFGLRLLMGLVGLSLLAFYGLAAWLTYALLATFWANRPPLGTTVLVVAGMTVVFGYLSYQFGTARILSSLDAVEIPRREAPGLYDRVDQLAAEMDVDSPRLLVAEMSLPNALALGSAGNGVVVLDRALFRFLTDEELLAILAHEFAHLESRDSLVQTMAYSAMRTVVGFVTFAFLPLLLFVTGVARAMAWIRGRPAEWSKGLFGQFQLFVHNGVALVFLVLTLLIRAHSRRREFAADDRAAEVTGRPLALARALSKIDRISNPDWGLLSPLYTRGDEDNGLGRIFSTHPGTDDRVERLVERANATRPQAIRLRY